MGVNWNVRLALSEIALLWVCTCHICVTGINVIGS